MKVSQIFKIKVLFQIAAAMILTSCGLTPSSAIEPREGVEINRDIVNVPDDSTYKDRVKKEEVAKENKKEVEKPYKEKIITKDEISTAKPAPNKPGFLINPFTGELVDAVGIPSGIKIRDPNDKLGRIFKTP